MTIPKCVAFIPDGNRRHAKKLGKADLWGHSRGLENIRGIARAVFEFGVRHVVFWGASESNLQKRSEREIAYLVDLLKQELHRRLDDPEGTRFYMRGAWARYVTDPELANLVGELERKTECYAERHFTLLFGYDGVTENVEAVKAYFHELDFSGRRISANVIAEVTDMELARHRWTSHIPSPDIIIRTGVEDVPNESDAFLPFIKKNALLYFFPVRWPEFDRRDLLDILTDYRERSPKLRKGA